MAFTKQLTRSSSYKIMLYLALVDVACLWINGLESAILGLSGDVYCTQPTLIYLSGIIGIGKT